MWNVVIVFGLFLRRTAKLSAEALGALYREKGALVLNRALLILRDRAAAEDVLQEVFVRLMLYGAPDGPSGVPLAYLYRTAERCCFDRLKKRGREVPVEDCQGVGIGFVQRDCEAKSEAAEIVLRFFDSLPEKLRQVGMLRYVDGMTQERIAQELNWSRRTVGKKLAELDERASRLIKRAAEVRGVPISGAQGGLSSVPGVGEERQA